MTKNLTKILTILLLESHFLSLYKNMTKQRVVNHGAIQKVRYLHNGILIPFTCVIFRQSYLITSPVLFKLWSGRKK